MGFNIKKWLKCCKTKAKNNGSIGKFFAFAAYLLIFFVLVYIFINGVNIFKSHSYEAFVIIGDSMEPEIKIGDVVIIKKVSSKDLDEGDVITYEKNDEYITHRITEIKHDGKNKVYTTKGDKNSVDDSEDVKFQDIKGVKVGKIPFIGVFIIIISKQKYIIIVLIIVYFLYKRAKCLDKRKIERRIKKKIEDERINDKKYNR